MSLTHTNSYNLYIYLHIQKFHIMNLGTFELNNHQISIKKKLKIDSIIHTQATCTQHIILGQAIL